MTRSCRCVEPGARRAASRRATLLPAALLAALLGATACDRREAPPKRAAPAAPRDTRPFTPWHAAGEPLPFPATEWYWQDLFAAAPAPEPLPADGSAAAEIAAAFERIATLDVLASEQELPALVDL